MARWRELVEAEPELAASAAAAASYAPADRYVLFELFPDELLATAYPEGVPRSRRWREATRP